MRLSQLQFRGLSSRFRGATPASIDFDALGPGLIALVGGNGAGKTTTMEAPAIALFQKMPTRPGSVYEWAQRADTFVEALWREGNRSITTRLLLDPSKKSSEAYFELRVDGELQRTDPKSDGKIGPFGELVRQYFGSWELFLAAPYAAQTKVGNFLAMPKGERKKLFAELIGLATLQQVSSWASASGATVEEQAAAVERTIQTLLEALNGKGDVERALSVAEAQLSANGQLLSEATAKLQEARGAVERARDAETNLRRLEERLSLIEGQARTAEEAFRRATTEQTKTGSRFESQLSAARAALNDLDEGALRRRQEREKGVFEQRESTLRSTLEEEPAIRAAIASLAQKDEELRGLRATQERRRGLESNLREAGHVCSAAEQVLAAARSQHTKLLEQLSARTALLDRVPCTAALEWQPVNRSPSAPVEAEDEVPLSATCLLLGDAQTAKGQAEAERARTFVAEEGTVEDARGRVAAIQGELELVPIVPASQLTSLEAEIRELNQRAGRLSLVDQARQTLGALAEERRHAEAQAAADLEALLASRARATERVQTLEADQSAALAEAKSSVAQAQAAKQQTFLAAADAREALGDARRTSASQREAIAALETAEKQLRALEEAGRQYNAEAERQRARLAFLGEQEDKLTQARATLASYDSERNDWVLLERAFGKDGIQAFEVDAAGPRVTDIANELLHACYGPQYSVKFETQRPLKSKDGYQEVFDIEVYDGGEKRLVEWLCGGEKVIVGEAIGLAIAIYNARTLGIRWETIFRDETSGALEPEWADRYVVMLRKALALGPFYQVVFVSHQERVYQAADVMLEVKGGAIRPTTMALAA